MAWLCVDEDGSEWLSIKRVERVFDFIEKGYWVSDQLQGIVKLKKGTIELLLGRKLTWADEAVKI